MLCSPRERWPQGWGLYVAKPSGKIFHSSSFELSPKSNPENGELLAMGLKFNGIEMNFAMGKPSNPDLLGIKRPSSMLFYKERIKSKITFDWHDHKSGKPIIYEHVGTYTGIAPGHNLPHLD